jgi:hypothetical protein
MSTIAETNSRPVPASAGEPITRLWLTGLGDMTANMKPIPGPTTQPR